MIENFIFKRFLTFAFIGFFYCNHLYSALVSGECEIVDTIEEAARYALENRSEEESYCVYPIKGKTFVGIYQTKIDEIDYGSLRECYFAITHTEPKIIHIIGSGDPFSEQGTTISYNFLCEQFSKYNASIQFGYTGSKVNNEAMRGANDLVSRYIIEHPEQAHRFLANIVGKMHACIKYKHYKVSDLVHNFILMYNQYGIDSSQMITTFGDDIIVSDSVLTNNDILIVLEGGTLTFRQAVNALLRNVKIIGLCNIKQDKHSSFFSTAYFLFKVQEELKENQELDHNNIIFLYNEYIQTHFRDIREEKERIFDEALYDFIYKDGYKNLIKAEIQKII